MARTLFCRRCNAGYPSIAGDVPRVCPHCGHAAGWTTQIALASEGAIEPVTALALNENDRRFLHRIGVEAD